MMQSFFYLVSAAEIHLVSRAGELFVLRRKNYLFARTGNVVSAG
jgi:hypothetical protein